MGDESLFRPLFPLKVYAYLHLIVEVIVWHMTRDIDKGGFFFFFLIFSNLLLNVFSNLLLNDILLVLIRIASARRF